MFGSNLRWSIEFTGGIRMTINGKQNIDKLDFEKSFINIDPAVTVLYNDD